MIDAQGHIIPENHEQIRNKTFEGSYDGFLCRKTGKISNSIFTLDDGTGKEYCKHCSYKTPGSILHELNEKRKRRKNKK